MKSSRFLLLVIVVFAFVLRAWNLSAQSLDIDEYSELQVQHKTYVEAALAADSMPPLFPVLLKSCLAIWPNDMTGRWFSVVVGVATVWVVGALWAKCFGHALALTTAALLAISPLHIYYSQYVRSYGFLMFWTALAIGNLAVAVKSNRKSDWGLFVISSLGGLYTHYYFAIFLGVLSLTCAIWAYGWKWSRAWLVSNLCVGVLALPLIGFVGKDLHFQKSLRDSRPLDVSALGYTYVSMLTGYSIGPSKRDLQVIDHREALTAALPIAATVGFIFFTLGFAGLGYLRQRRFLAVFVVLAVVPVLVVGLLGAVAGVTYNPRFVVWSLPPLLALLAAGIVHGHRWWFVRAAMLALVLVSVVAVYNRQSVAAYQNEDIRSLGAYLQQESTPLQPVFVISNYMVPLVAQYLPSDQTVFELPPVEETDEIESIDELVPLAEQTLAEQVPKSGKYWLVYTRSFHGDPEGNILARLSENAALNKVQEFAGVVLYRGEYKLGDLR